MITSLFCVHFEVILLFLEKYSGLMVYLYFLFRGCGFWVSRFVFHIEDMYSRLFDLSALSCDCICCRRLRYLLLCSRCTHTSSLRNGSMVFYLLAMCFASAIDAGEVASVRLYLFSCSFRFSSIANSPCFVWTLCARGRLGVVRRLGVWRVLHWFCQIC